MSGESPIRRARRYLLVAPRQPRSCGIPPAQKDQCAALEIRGAAEAIEKPSDSAYGSSDPIIRVRARPIISYGTEEKGAIPG